MVSRVYFLVGSLVPSLFSPVRVPSSLSFLSRKNNNTLQGFLLHYRGERDRANRIHSFAEVPLGKRAPEPPSVRPAALLLLVGPAAATAELALVLLPRRLEHRAAHGAHGGDRAAGARSGATPDDDSEFAKGSAAAGGGGTAAAVHTDAAAAVVPRSPSTLPPQRRAPAPPRPAYVRPPAGVAAEDGGALAVLLLLRRAGSVSRRWLGKLDYLGAALGRAPIVVVGAAAAAASPPLSSLPLPLPPEGKASRRAPRGYPVRG